LIVRRFLYWLGGNPRVIAGVQSNLNRKQLAFAVALQLLHNVVDREGDVGQVRGIERFIVVLDPSRTPHPN
jgi:hypothetical protein